MLAVGYRTPVSDRHVWGPLIALVVSAESGHSRRWRTRAEAVSDRDAERFSPQEQRLVWFALALPGAGLLAVAVVLVAHAFTAHS